MKLDTIRAPKEEHGNAQLVTATCARCGGRVVTRTIVPNLRCMRCKTKERRERAAELKQARRASPDRTSNTPLGRRHEHGVPPASPPLPNLPNADLGLRGGA